MKRRMLERIENKCYPSVFMITKLFMFECPYSRTTVHRWGAFLRSSMLHLYYYFNILQLKERDIFASNNNKKNGEFSLASVFTHQLKNCIKRFKTKVYLHKKWTGDASIFKNRYSSHSSLACFVHIRILW